MLVPGGGALLGNPGNHGLTGFGALFGVVPGDHEFVGALPCVGAFLGVTPGDHEFLGA